MSDAEANTQAHMLATDSNSDYLVMDMYMKKGAANEVAKRFAVLEMNIKTRVFF